MILVNWVILVIARKFIIGESAELDGSGDYCDSGESGGSGESG